MALGKVLSSTAKVEVNTAYPAGPVWATVGGLLTVTRDSSDQREDTGGLSDQIAHVKTDTMPRWVARAFLLADPDVPGARDPAQHFLSDLSAALYSASIGQVRITPAGCPRLTFLCTVDVQDPADDIDGYVTWQATIFPASTPTEG